MIDLWQEIYGTVRRNKLRTVLTGCAVAWGIFILIVLLGAGNGLLNAQTEQMSSLAMNSLQIGAGWTSKPYDGLKQGRRIQLNNGDLEISSRMFEIRAALQAPDSITIRSGYSANAEIVLERAQQVLTIPEKAVEFSGDTTYIYVLTDSVPQQQFRRQAIQIGMSDGIRIAVNNGIHTNEKIRGSEIKQANE